MLGDRKHTLCTAPVIAALLWLNVLSAAAGTVTFTARTAFLAALPDPASTLGLDSTSAGTPIPSGSGIGPIKFSHSIAGAIGIGYLIGWLTDSVGSRPERVVRILH